MFLNFLMIDSKDPINSLSSSSFLDKFPCNDSLPIYEFQQIDSEEEIADFQFYIT
jgi:hypothetical protein